MFAKLTYSSDTCASLCSLMISSF